MSEVRRFRKKPVEIEAVRFDGDQMTTGFIRGWIAAAEHVGPVYVRPGQEHALRRAHEYDPSNGHCYPEDAPQYLVIHTLEGDMRADVGDWIIRGVAGEFYPCKPDIFAATYEAVSDCLISSERCDEG